MAAAPCSSVTSIGLLAPHTSKVSPRRPRNPVISSAWSHHRRSLTGLTMNSSGMNNGFPIRGTTARIPAVGPGPVNPSGGNVPIPNMPPWAKWVVGAVIVAIPIYRRFRTLEDKIEKTAEVAIEVVDTVAEATEKVAGEIADAFPGNENLKEAASRIKTVTDEIEEDAEKAEALIQKSSTDDVEERFSLSNPMAALSSSVPSVSLAIHASAVSPRCCGNNPVTSTSALRRRGLTGLKMNSFSGMNNGGFPPIRGGKRSWHVDNKFHAATTAVSQVFHLFLVSEFLQLILGVLALLRLEEPSRRFPAFLNGEGKISYIIAACSVVLRCFWNLNPFDQLPSGVLNLYLCFLGLSGWLVLSYLRCLLTDSSEQWKVEQTAEAAIEVIDKVAEETEKIADEVAEAFPGNEMLKKAASRIKAVADEIEEDADKAEALIEKLILAVGLALLRLEETSPFPAFLNAKIEKTAEVAIEVIDKVAEETEKIADEVAHAFPGNETLKKAASRIKAVADEIEEDADKAEALIKKVLRKQPKSCYLPRFATSHIGKVSQSTKQFLTVHCSSC
ncbi:hypothetical protein BAE44_0003326 [Dichanthelium oligosanthes]|uniref:Uncharacterized protein n=1 Tax=Dichanthelium oligosanthes TaxID=888268 RepID=A0A1E5WE28_9POAL|nr:hypothetical protein BAE44_0003326 [Dichanthelium oligosanthes]